jgi:ribonuclease HIII
VIATRPAGSPSPPSPPTSADDTGVIGIDESGKGDYFGPLVIAAVHVDDTTAPLLVDAGVRDSKRLSDARATALARVVADTCPTSVVAIGPERYNALYARISNLNRLLAWGHARVLENLLERVPCRNAIADQFGDERFVRQALMERGQSIALIQRPRAEVHPAVAAASVVARAEFLRRLAALGAHYGVVLPKGAGPPVLQAGRAFVHRHGREALDHVAKIHFRTTAQILA